MRLARLTQRKQFLAAADHGRPDAIRTLKLDALKWHGVVGVAVAAGLGVGVG